MKKFNLLWLMVLTACGPRDRPVSEEFMLDVGGADVYLEVWGRAPKRRYCSDLHGGPGNVVAGVLTFEANVGRQLEEAFS